MQWNRSDVMYCEATPRDAPRPEPESPRRVPRQSDASRAMKSDGDAAREILDLRARVLEREAALARAIGEKEDAEAAAASALEKLNRLRLAREEEVSTRDDTIRALEGRVRELECRDASLTAAREAAEKILTTRAGEADALAREATRRLAEADPASSDAWSIAARDVLRAKRETETLRLGLRKLEREMDEVRRTLDEGARVNAERRRALATPEETRAHAERLKNYERALEEGVEILERVRKTARARDTETSSLRAALVAARTHARALERELDIATLNARRRE